MNWISRMQMMISISLHMQRLVYDYGWIQSRSVFLACFLHGKMTHPQINNILINNDIIPNVVFHYSERKIQRQLARARHK